MGRRRNKIGNHPFESSSTEIQRRADAYTKRQARLIKGLEIPEHTGVNYIYFKKNWLILTGNIVLAHGGPHIEEKDIVDWAKFLNQGNLPTRLSRDVPTEQEKVLAIRKLDDESYN